MKRTRTIAFAALVGLVLALVGSAPQSEGGQKKDEKILTIGNDGVKIKGKLTNETKNIPYAIKLEEGKTYQIRLTSKDFDAYLFLKDDKGKQLDYDDDSGGGRNSLLEYRVLTAGVYIVIATSLGMEGTGDFELTVTQKP